MISGKINFICILLVVLFHSAAAQEPAVAQEPPKPKEEKKFWDRIYIGGNLGLQFGSVTVVNVSPQIGYRVTERFVPGIGITYIYYNYRNPYTNSRFESSIYGGSLFGKYFITDNLFAHAEYEQLNMESYDPFLQKYSRLWVPSFFIGGGYRQMLGQRGFIQLMVLFEVLQDRNSIYYRNNPVIRIGFGF